MRTSKSPRMVMAEALAVGEACLPAYSHRFSPHKFTQPQLFACLVLKEFEKKDYRGVCQLLVDCSDLRAVIGLKIVPHFTTLQKASERLLTLPHVRRLLERTVRDVHGRRKVVVPYAAGDSSGFEARHASRYFVWQRDNNEKKGEKRPKKRHRSQRYGKLMVIVCCLSHAILAAVASEGPTPDIDQLDEVLAELPAATVNVKHLVLDAGFDSAHNHRLLRDTLGIRSTIPPEHGRPPNDPATPPRDKYRRLMWARFNRRAYRRRPQVETVISMLKRNLGSALRARSVPGRRRDLRLRVLTHNITLALLRLFYRAVHDPLRSRPFKVPCCARSSVRTNIPRKNASPPRTSLGSSPSALRVI